MFLVEIFKKGESVSKRVCKTEDLARSLFEKEYKRIHGVKPTVGFYPTLDVSLEEQVIYNKVDVYEGDNTSIDDYKTYLEEELKEEVEINGLDEVENYYYEIIGNMMNGNDTNELQTIVDNLPDQSDYEREDLLHSSRIQNVYDYLYARVHYELCLFAQEWLGKKRAEIENA